MNRKINLNIGDENLLLQTVKIKEIVQKKCCILKESFSIDQALRVLAKSQVSDGYVLNKEGELINKFELPQLLIIKNKNKKIETLNTQKFLKLNSDENVLNALEICKNFVGESIPVVSKENKLLGIITESDLFKSFLNASKHQREIELQN